MRVLRIQHSEDPARSCCGTCLQRRAAAFASLDRDTPVRRVDVGAKTRSIFITGLVYGAGTSPAIAVHSRQTDINAFVPPKKQLTQCKTEKIVALAITCSSRLSVRFVPKRGRTSVPVISWVRGLWAEHGCCSVPRSNGWRRGARCEFSWVKLAHRVHHSIDFRPCVTRSHRTEQRCDPRSVGLVCVHRCQRCKQFSGGSPVSSEQLGIPLQEKLSQCRRRRHGFHVAKIFEDRSLISVAHQMPEGNPSRVPVGTDAPPRDPTRADMLRDIIPEIPPHPE